MTFFYLEIVGIVVSVAILFLLSMVEAALMAASAVTLRMSLEREEEGTSPLLPLVIENKSDLFLPLHLGIQIALIAVTILDYPSEYRVLADMGRCLCPGFGLGNLASLPTTFPKVIGP